jgi:TfoX/Sxy family transcriptional regulator of competence genes
MFGGIGYMVQGNMACGIQKGKLIVRVGRDAYQDALRRPHSTLFDMTGREMKGWVVVLPDGYEADEDLAAWVEQGVAFALTLPAK